MNDLLLSQMVKEPTRGENMNDPFMTTNLFFSITIISGLADHDIVSCVIDTKPELTRKRTASLHFLEILV